MYPTIATEVITYSMAFIDSTIYCIHFENDACVCLWPLTETSLRHSQMNAAHAEQAEKPRHSQFDHYINGEKTKSLCTVNLVPCVFIL